MNSGIFALDFTPAELALVASLLDAPSLPVLEDSAPEWSAEGIEGPLAQAQESLADRQYIQVQPDGSIALDTAVAALVGALAFAESSLIVTHFVGEDESPCTRRIHFASGLIVEQEHQRDNSHSLTAVRDRGTVCQRLREFLHLVDQTAPSCQPCALPEVDIVEAPLVLATEGEVACVEFLKRAGAPSGIASSLVEVLAHPISQSTLLALVWEEEGARPAGGFKLLEGVDGLWLFRQLQRDGESWMEVAPCDASSAIRELEELTRIVIPPAQE